jgi:hypothetical protein
MASFMRRSRNSGAAYRVEDGIAAIPAKQTIGHCALSIWQDSRFARQGVRNASQTSPRQPRAMLTIVLIAFDTRAIQRYRHIDSAGMALANTLSRQCVCAFTAIVPRTMQAHDWVVDANASRSPNTRSPKDATLIYIVQTTAVPQE